MTEIILTKGLPGSGKTTWALEYLKTNPNHKRINKDDMRQMVDGGKWTHKNEKVILSMRDLMVTNLLEMGYSVIIDDTNFNLQHEARMRAIAAEHKAAVKIVDFTNVPVEECIARDLKRPNSVGSKVIMRMYNQYLRPVPEKEYWDPQKRFCVICDIDGTLALMGDRGPFEWTKVGMDSVNEPVADLVRKLRSSPEGKAISMIIFSGRDGSCQPETELWLKENGIIYDHLYMRAPGDMRKDSIVKRELFDAHIRDTYNVLFVIDDRNQVVDMWRHELGLTCLQVAEGDF